MANKISMTAALCALAAAGQAGAAEIYADDGGWRVSMDRDVPSCTAEQKPGGRGIVIHRADGTTVSFLDPAFSRLTPGTEYPVEVVIDSSRYNGKMAAGRVGSAGAVQLYEPNDGFMAAISAGRRISLTAEGRRAGPFSLSGSSKAIKDVERCMEAAAEPDAPDVAAVIPADGAGLAFLPDDHVDSWGPADVNRTLTAGDVTLLMRTRTNPDESVQIVVDVSKEGHGTVSFDIDGTYAMTGTVGFVKMEPWSDDSQFFFTNFTGGAHCCMEVRVVTFSGGEAELVEFGSFDVGGVQPEDIDGDGYEEIAVPDDRFRIFSSYAGSFPPSRILSILEGAVDDRTKDRSFAPYHESRFALQSKECGLVAQEKPGACAGLLGTAALLGVVGSAAGNLDFDTEGEEAAMFSPFLVCGSIGEDFSCEDGREFDRLDEAVRHALAEWGYMPPRAEASFSDAMSRLEGKAFGLGDADSEMGCEMGPTSFVKSQSDFAGAVWNVGGYESGCSVDRGAVVGGAIFVRALCQGEGEPQWIERRVYVPEKGGLSTATAVDWVPDQSAVQELEECAP